MQLQYLIIIYIYIYIILVVNIINNILLKLLFNTRIGVKSESCIVFRPTSADRNRYMVEWYIDLKDAPAYRPAPTAEQNRKAMFAAALEAATGKGGKKKKKK